MKVKTFARIILSAVLLFSMPAESAYAQISKPQIDIVSPLYEIADDPMSTLRFDGKDAYCTSYTSGTDTVSITVEQTIEKYSGWFWIWNNVEGATWKKTVNSDSIFFSNTKSGLESGTYRLKSVFTLTNSSGKTETITVYSSEKKI